MITADALLICQRKLARLRSGGSPRALEICSGCGGLSLGLQTAGFELAAHIEIDPEAARSYALNFANGRDLEGAWAAPRNMESVSADQLVAELKLPTATADLFDLLAAGLPCQAFYPDRSIETSLCVWRRRGCIPRRTRAPRCIVDFLKYIEDTQPLAIVIENVPDILNFGGHNVPEEICEHLEAAGYSTGYTLLNAAYFGVPQIRERLFIVALARDLGENPRFPAPTFAELPSGYQGTRRVALKHVDQTSGRFHQLRRTVRDVEAGGGDETGARRPPPHNRACQRSSGHPPAQAHRRTALSKEQEGTLGICWHDAELGWLCQRRRYGRSPRPPYAARLPHF